MRIAVGGIWHETNTFVPDVTGLDAFAAYQLHEGDELLRHHRGSQTEIGGVIAAADELGVELRPLCYAAAVPSGLVAAAAFGDLVARVTAGLGDQHVDGVVLALHGAMVVEGESDPELTLVRAVREVAGDVPIAVVLDLHANLSAELAQESDLIVGYQTFPHVDMGDRGAEALRILCASGRGLHALERTLIRLPLLTVPQMQGTGDEPLASLERVRRDLAEMPEAVSISMFPGYPYADLDRLGFAVYAAGEPGFAQRAVRRLAEAVWAVRERFKPALLEPGEALAATADANGPVVLVDVADNVGGGSPGDGTVILEAMVARHRPGVVLLWDPNAIAGLYSSTTELVALDVGGRATRKLGAPVPIEGRATRLGRVSYRRRGRYMQGQQVDMGRVVRVATDGPQVVLTERRVMPFDDDHLRAVGIVPEDQQILVAKSALAWREAFGPYAAAAHYVRCPGYCPSDLGQLEYNHRPRPAFPLEEEATWP